MSRYYRMGFKTEIESNLIEEGIEEKIEDIFSRIWELDPGSTWSMEDEDVTSVFCGGEDSLYGGQSEEDFAKIAFKLLKKSLSFPFRLSVMATYLEDLPFEEYSFESK